MRRAAVLGLALAFGVVPVSRTQQPQESHFQNVPAKDHARTNPLAGNAKAASAGAALYREHCAQCHGADARGDGVKKPSLRTVSVQNATDGDLEWFLRQGDLRHGMPSWSNLPQVQRWAIIAYLRTLQ